MCARLACFAGTPATMNGRMRVKVRDEPERRVATLEEARAVAQGWANVPAGGPLLALRPAFPVGTPVRYAVYPWTAAVTQG